MKPQPTANHRGESKRLAEGLYQYSQSKEYYARFRHRGERIMQKLGSNEHPYTGIPEAKRLLRALKNCLEHPLIITGWPLQLLQPAGPLSNEALAEAVELRSRV